MGVEANEPEEEVFSNEVYQIEGPPIVYSAGGKPALPPPRLGKGNPSLILPSSEGDEGFCNQISPKITYLICFNGNINIEPQRLIHR